jgi:murein DD-endopeptidase MepM/ murein hydrolase activator NlpD
MVVLLFLGLISGTTFLAWIVRDYLRIKDKIPLLTEMQKRNELQKEQFVHLAQRIDQITSKMRELKEFDYKLKVMVNLETDEDDQKFQGIGGSDPEVLRSQYSMAKTHQGLVKLMHKSLDSLDGEIVVGKQNKTELHKFLDEQKTLLASTPSIWPTKGWLSSRFGYRESPFTGEREFHRGIDISARMNAPIVAPADGIVSAIRKDHGYGNTLVIKHGYGISTKYAHLKKTLVKKGQYIRRGETIALVGSTGRSTGPHLHYEVHLNGVPVNPLRHILN